MMHSEDIRQQLFKDILFHAYKLGTEVEDIKIESLIEEIKQQLLAALVTNK
ncbi:hypothetical protein V7068_12920 [Bacillus sp. JJ634]